MIRCLARLACLAVLLLVPEARAQGSRLVETDDWAYVYVQRLQRRGHLLELDPTTLAYTRSALREAVRKVDARALPPLEHRWLSLLSAASATVRTARGEAVLGGSVDLRLAATNSDRLDPLRPTGTGDPHLQLAGVRLYPEATTRVFVEKGRFVAQAGLHQSLFYDTDPDGLDAAHRLYGRSESTYLGYGSPWFSAYFGRFSNHWAAPGETAALVSDNPLPYDHLNLRLGGQRLSLHAIAGELDSALPDGTYTGRTGDLPALERAGVVRRYISAHRLNWRPSPRFSLSLMESVLYSGPGAGFSLKYLNPLQILVFEVDSRPKNDENNGMIGALLWTRLHRATLTGQILLDDFDFMAASGEPASFAATGSLTYGGLFGSADVGLRVEAVSARVYNTHQPEGRHIYLLRGLATQFNDYVRATAFADLYLDPFMPGLTLSPQLHVLWQGERDIRDDYGELDASVGAILTGAVERTVRPALEVHLQRNPRWWLRGNIGPNFTFNDSHRQGERRTEWVGVLTLGARLSAARTFRLSFD